MKRVLWSARPSGRVRRGIGVDRPAVSIELVERSRSASHTTMEFQSFAAGGAIADGVGAAKFGAIAHLAQYTVAEEEGREDRPNEEADWRSPECADRGRAGWERQGAGRAAAST